MQSVNIELHSHGLDYHLKLEEQEGVTNETFCVEGRNFRLSLEGESADISAIWARIQKLDHRAISLEKLCATILGVDSVKPESEEQLKLLSGINALAERYLKDQRREEGHNLTYRLEGQSLDPLNGTEKKDLDRHDFSYRLADDCLAPLRGRVKEDWKIIGKNVEDSLRNLREADYGVLESEQASIFDIFSKAKGAIEKVKKEFFSQKLHHHKVALLKLGFETLQLMKSQQDNQELLTYLLELAISVDHIAYVSDLFQAGAKPEAHHVYYAVVGNSVPMMRKLADHGAYFALDRLLEIACIRGKKSEAALFELLRLGANLDSKNEYGVTPMMLAMSSDLSISSLKRLLAYVEDINQVDNDGDTLLAYAITRQSFFPDVEIIKEVLNRGAISNTKNNVGQTPLHLAAKFLHGANLVESVRILVDRGAIPTAIDRMERTPFHLLGSNYKLDGQQLITAMKELLRGGGNVNAQDNQGKTLLHYYLILSQPDVVSFLAKNGIDLNLKDDEGNTPLHIAARELMVESVEALIKHRANRFVQNKRQQLPGAMPTELNPEQTKTKKILTLLSKPSI